MQNTYSKSKFEIGIKESNKDFMLYEYVKPSNKMFLEISDMLNINENVCIVELEIQRYFTLIYYFIYRKMLQIIRF